MSTYGSGYYGAGPYGGVALSHLNATTSTVDATSYQITGTPLADSVIVLAVASVATSPPTPAISDSTGKTWTLIRTGAIGTRRLSSFYAVFSGASPGLVTFTASFAGTQDACALSLDMSLSTHLTSPLVQSAIASA